MSGIGRNIAGKVAAFFGVSKTESYDSIEQWVEKMESKVKNREFGLHMTQSFNSKRGRSNSKFVSDAKRIMSQIEAAQKYEDENVSQDVERKQGKKGDGKRVKVKSEEDSDPKPGPSGLKGILKNAGSKSKSSTVEIVFNDSYSEEEEPVDLGSRAEFKGSSEIIPDKLMYSTASQQGSPRKSVHKGTSSEEPTVVFFNEVLQQKASSDQTERELKDEQNTKIQSSDDDQQKQTVKEDKVGTAKTDVPGQSGEQSSNENKDGEDSGNNQKGQSEKEVLTDADLVYGKDAMIHYSFYKQIENKTERQRLIREMGDKMQEYDWKINAIDELIAMAKDYYLNPKSKNANQWKDLKRRVRRSSSHKLGRTEVRRKLDTLPDYRPYFTWFIILTQVITTAVLCGLGKITDIGVEPKLVLEKDVQTFMGMETVHGWSSPNIWIGPSQKFLISVGAMYAPCMRKDLEIQVMYAKQGFSDHAPLGCCEIHSRNVAGTATEKECASLTEGFGTWRNGSTCANRPIGQQSVRHIMRPCCIGLKGQCHLLSHKHCTFLNGTFSQFGPEHCSQVNCLKGLCKMGDLEASADQPWIPAEPYQWWRLPLSLIYHNGVIHVALVVVAQWILFTQIETTAGWLRMVIIYILSGFGALLTSTINSPYQTHVGGHGAVFGMVGVVLVELIQFWTLVQSPWIELIKLISAIVFLLLCGTLPYLDFFGMLSGFMIGALSGVIVLPYITFAKWQTTARIVFVSAGLPLLIVIFSVLLHMFIKVQGSNYCDICKTINCIPYTKNMCNVTLWEDF